MKKRNLSILVFVSLGLLVFFMNPFSIIGDRPDFSYLVAPIPSDCDFNAFTGNSCPFHTGEFSGILRSGDFEFVPSFDMDDDGQLSVVVNNMPLTLREEEVVEVSPGVSVRFQAVNKEFKTFTRSTDGMVETDKKLVNVQYRFDWFIDVGFMNDLEYVGVTKAVLRQPEVITFNIKSNTAPIRHEGGLKYVQSSESLFIGSEPSLRPSTIPSSVDIHLDTSQIGLQNIEAQPFVKFCTSSQCYNVLSSEGLSVSINVQPLSEVFNELESGKVVETTTGNILDVPQMFKGASGGSESLLLLMITGLVIVIGAFVLFKK